MSFPAHRHPEASRAMLFESYDFTMRRYARFGSDACTALTMLHRAQCYAPLHDLAGRLPGTCSRFDPRRLRRKLTIDGLVEDEVFVGDVHRIGSALLQVCQPRQPRFKLALHFGDKRLPSAMVKSGRAGWYYRVLEASQLGAGDEVELVARPQPGFSLSRLITIINHGEATSAEIIALATMPELASGLCRLAEDWLRVRN